MISISYSQIRSLQRCGIAYKLSWIDNVSIPSSGEMFLGGTIHLVFATLQRMRMDGTLMSLSDCEDLFVHLFHSRAFSDVFWKNESEPELQRSIGLELVKVYYPHAIKIDPMLIEEEFPTKLLISGEEVEIKSRIDLVDKNGIPYDIKTAAYQPREMRPADLLQPLLYAICLGAKEIKYVYHYLIKGKQFFFVPKTVQILEDDVKWVKEVAIPAWVGQIKSGIFSPSVANCSTCDYRLLGYCHGFIGKG
jgi:hypothetical protein